MRDSLEDVRRNPDVADAPDWHNPAHEPAAATARSADPGAPHPAAWSPGGGRRERPVGHRRARRPAHPRAGVDVAADHQRVADGDRGRRADRRAARTSPGRRAPHPGPLDPDRQLLAVGVGTAAYQGFYFVSVTQVGVAVATVVSLGLAPVMLTVAESVRHRRAPSPGRVAVLVAALTGLVLVSAAAAESTTGPAPTAGVLLAIASGTTYALTTVAGGSISRTTSPLVLTSGMTLVGAAVLLPCLALVDGPRLTTSPAALAWLVYLGALTMALAYVLLYSGLRVVAPSTAVTASLVEPVTAAVVAAVVLDEPLGPVAVDGILLTLGAVAGLGGRVPRPGRCCRNLNSRDTSPRRSPSPPACCAACRRGRRARARRPCWTAGGGRGPRCLAPAAHRASRQARRRGCPSRPPRRRPRCRRRS